LNQNSNDSSLIKALLIDAPPLSFELDREGSTIWISNSLATLTAQPSDTVVGASMEDLINILLVPEWQIQAENSIFRILQGVDSFVRFKGFVKGRGTSEFFEFTVSPTEGGGAIVVGALSEVVQSYASQLDEVQETQGQLSEQKERLEVLYEVSKALQLNLDPSLVALKGLTSLLDVTHSDSGIVFFYNDKTDYFEIAAIQGVPEAHMEELERLINGPSLVRYAVGHQETILVDNIQTDTRAVIRAARIKGLASAMVSPLLVGNRCMGALVIFRNEVKAYRETDVPLISAAASQIAAATFQAELYANEKKQAGYFAALYRLSHELSGHLNIKDISERAFHIINRELACKRMWLGTINEQGTHLVGQAGFGPGVRAPIISAQVEIDRDNPNVLATCLSKKEPILVSAEEWRSCERLKSIVGKFDLETCALVPLVSMAQPIGVLVIEPLMGAGFFNQQKLSFLGSMASEIAVVILANRFQNKAAEADKMRMAGLFAGAIAHNFNNMLQVILGQASLIEMQDNNPKSTLEAASLIKSAALKGASLIKQLLNYSASDTFKKEIFSVHSFVEESKDLYKAILGTKISLNLNTNSEDLRVEVDRSQLQQVISNILMNSKEAMVGESGNVWLTTHSVYLNSGEIDPEVPPGRYARIDIKDDGIGMSEDVRNRCFEPFFTTKNTDPSTGIGVGGSGLGLSSAYSIVKKSGGTITVQSNEYGGSVFSIYLPVVEYAFNAKRFQGVDLSTGGKDKDSGGEPIRTGPSVSRYKGNLNKNFI